jgi:hypothetical protein
MIFELSNPFALEKFEKAVERVKERGGIVELTEKKSKTRPQNNYLHLILGKFALETGYTTDEVKYRFFKKEVNPLIFVRTKVNPRGKEITYVRSTGELSKEEMSEAIDRFLNWSAANGIPLPSADDYRLLQYIESELRNNRYA